MADNLDLLVLNTTNLDGMLTAETKDHDGDKNRVLENGRLNHIQVSWKLTGTLITDDVLTGSWHLQAFFERIGAGPEFSVPSLAPIDVAWDHDGTYSITIPIPAGTVPAGAYKVVVLLSHLNASGRPTRMAGFVELPMVRFI